MQKIFGFVELMRPLNCFIAAFAVFVGYAVSVKALQFNQQIGFAMIAAFLVCGAGQSINDFFDRQIDKKKNPKKPVPSGSVSAESALLFSVTLFLFGNVFAFFVNQTALVISLTFTLLLFFYSAFLGKAKFLGNWVVAAGTAFTLVFGATISGNYFVVLFFAASALLANAAREIIKDTEDLKADRGFKKSLPMILRKEQLVLLLVLLHVVALVSAFVPLALGLFGNTQFALFVLAANALFAYSIFHFGRNNYSLAQKLSKTGMLFSLFGFLLGVV